MKKSALNPVIFALLSTALTLTSMTSEACTSFVISASDGGYVYGRTLEFGINLESAPIAIPRNYKYQGTGVNGQPGKTWKTKYAVIGMNGVHLPILVDGLNEKGMSGGLLYAPNTAEYQELKPENSSNSIASYEMLTYALTNFATIDEVREGFSHILVNKTGHAPFNGSVPLHMTLHDANHKNLVIEYNHGILYMYDNPTGVMTNDPNFAFQLANLGQYANLSPKESTALKINGADFAPPSSGSGLHGIPGDSLSPSRFIRATFYSAAAPLLATTDMQVAVAFHILNNFDIPPGSIQLSDKNPYGGGTSGFEKTEWLAVADAKNLIYYVKTYENQTAQSLAMKNVNLDAKEIKNYTLSAKEAQLEIK